jgi:hypothetical protein
LIGNMLIRGHRILDAITFTSESNAMI